MLVSTFVSVVFYKLCYCFQRIPPQPLAAQLKTTWRPTNSPHRSEPSTILAILGKGEIRFAGNAEGPSWTFPPPEVWADGPKLSEFDAEEQRRGSNSADFESGGAWRRTLLAAPTYPEVRADGIFFSPSCLSSTRRNSAEVQTASSTRRNSAEARTASLTRRNIAEPKRS